MINQDTQGVNIMTHEEFFKIQAKNLLHDYKSFTDVEQFMERESKFFSDDLFLYYGLDEVENFSLMKAQHIIAETAGFKKWNDLIKANSNDKELARLIYDNSNSSDDVENWKWYCRYAKLSELDSATRLLVAKQFFNNKSNSVIEEANAPEIIDGPDAVITLKRELKNLFDYHLDTQVKCFHCGDTFKCREMKVVQSVSNNFDYRPMVMCKNYPKCNGTIIDLKSLEINEEDETPITYSELGLHDFNSEYDC